MQPELKGQVALVTGGGRGLGRATALGLAARGVNVVVADILEHEAQQTGRDLETAGVGGLGVVCDVSDEAQVEKLIERVVNEFGQLDILVNTVAWIDPPGLLVDMPLDIWQQTLTFDLTSHFLACKHALKVMLPRNYGRIVNTSSEAGKGGYRLRGAYCAAKAGVISLSQTLAAETAEYDITVNAICPRGIAGPRLDTLRTLFAEYTEMHGEQPRPAGVGRPPMQPAEVADTILFLVSPQGARINGQAISIG
jgi:NAD(P)-dependent dehydrogenase (short-subunit alcohol dehydrogenase family)